MMTIVETIKEWLGKLLVVYRDGFCFLDDILSGEIGKKFINTMAAYLWKPILRLVILNCKKDQSVGNWFREFAREILLEGGAVIFTESGTVPVKVDVTDDDGKGEKEQTEPNIFGIPEKESDTTSDTTEDEELENGEKEEESDADEVNGEPVEGTPVEAVEVKQEGTPETPAEKEPEVSKDEEDVEVKKPTTPQSDPLESLKEMAEGGSKGGEVNG